MFWRINKNNHTQLLISCEEYLLIKVGNNTCIVNLLFIKVHHAQIGTFNGYLIDADKEKMQAQAASSVYGRSLSMFVGMVFIFTEGNALILTLADRLKKFSHFHSSVCKEHNHYLLKIMLSRALSTLELPSVS